MKKEYEVLPHTADLQIRVYGKDLKELFRNAVRGMFDSIHPEFDPEFKGREKNRRKIEVESHDLEALLVDFLSEALYLSDVHGEAYLDVEILEMSKTRIKGVLLGTPIIDFGSGEIKAVTHHGLYVKQIDGGWAAEVLFDL